MKRTFIFIIVSFFISLTLCVNLKKREKPIMKGGDFCNEQVVELNIPAEKLLNNLRNMSLPISIEPLFEEMNGKKSKDDQMPGSDASCTDKMINGDGESISNISRKPREVEINGNRTCEEGQVDKREENFGGAGERLRRKTNATNAANGDEEEIEDEEIPTSNDNKTAIDENGEVAEEEESMGADNNTAPKKNATETEPNDEEKVGEENGMKPKNASETSSISNGKRSDESEETEIQKPTNKTCSTNKTDLPDEEEYVIIEEVEEEPEESKRGMMSNETDSLAGNETAPTQSSSKSAREEEEEMNGESITGMNNKNKTQTENGPSNESAEQMDMSNKTSSDMITGESEGEGEGADGAEDKTSDSIVDQPSNATKIKPTNETKAEGISDKTNASDFQKSFISRTGEVIGAKLPSKYIPSEGWWQGWNTIPKSFWVGNDFKAGNEFIKLMNSKNISISATPEGEVTTSNKPDDVSSLFLVEFIAQNIVNLRSYFGGYLSISEEGSVSAKSKTASTDTQFTVLKTNRKCKLDDANYIFLRSSNGKYLTIIGSNVTGRQSVSNQALYKGMFWDQSESKCKNGGASGAEEAESEGTQGEEGTEMTTKTAPKSTRGKKQQPRTDLAKKTSKRASETPSGLGSGKRKRNGKGENGEEENAEDKKKLAMSRNKKGSNVGRDSEKPLLGSEMTIKQTTFSMNDEERTIFLEQISDTKNNNGNNKKLNDKLQNTSNKQKKPNVKSQQGKSKVVCPYGKNKKLLILNIV